MSEPIRAPTRGATVAVVATFVILGFLGIVRHEMWRDELEIWLIARDSGSLSELLTNMGTEAHPVLWYALNFVIARLTHDPFYMQILSLAIGAATVYVFFAHAPFGTLQRLLFCFGYFPLYEYTVISRNYGLQLLLTFVFCTIFSRARDAWLAQAVVLALLANTHLYGTILAAIFGGFLLAVEIVPSIRRGRPRAGANGAIATAVILAGVAAGAGHVFVQIRRLGAEHLSFVPGWDLRWVTDSLSTVYRAYFPLPNVLDPHFWNSNVLDLVPEPARGIAGAGLAALVVAGSASLLAHRRAALFAYFAGGAAMMTITLFFWPGWLRHHGQIFLMFVACYWLARPPAHPFDPGDDDGPGRSRIADRAFTVVLAAQVVAAGYAYASDLVRPFSNAEATGAFVERPALREAVIVGSIDYAAQSIAAYVGRPIYYPESERFGTFLDWSEARRHVSSAEVLEDAVALATESKRDVVVALNYPVRRPRLGEVVPLNPRMHVEGLANFTGAIVEDEDFFVFRVFDPKGQR